MNLSACSCSDRNKSFLTEIRHVLQPSEESKPTESFMKKKKSVIPHKMSHAHANLNPFKHYAKVKLTSPCCLASAAPITMICVVINGGYRTGSEVDSLWVQASVAEGSALPWKIEHLGASWRTSLPCCATTTQVPTGAMPPPARSHWTKAGQMVPLPTNEQPLRTAHCPLPLPYHSTQG